MERQLKLVFKRDNRNNLTFIYCTDKKINLEKLGIDIRGITKSKKANLY